MKYGLRYYASFRSLKKNLYWRIEIEERNYSGLSEQIQLTGKPLTLTFEKRNDEFHIPIKASEISISIWCTKQFEYTHLFTAEPRKFRVSIFRNTKLYWRGFVVADTYSEAFSAPPYEVVIKAVDGFNLLSSLPFTNMDDSNITGQKSLWELISMCIDALELNLDVADWMDLYPANSDTSISPLRQIYVNLDRLYYVYEEPSYKDILELCLKPFGAQIFQANGAINIRRSVSLYSDSRPLSFYKIGADFPTGWLLSADGENIITHDGEPIITQITRERIDSMWDEDIKIKNSATLEIVPAIRKILINVENKLIDNFCDIIKFYDKGRWEDPNNFIAIYQPNSLTFWGNSNHRDSIVSHRGFFISQCTCEINIEFSIKNEWKLYSGSTYIPSWINGSRKSTLNYSIKLISENKTYWINESEEWIENEGWLTKEVETGKEENIKINLKNGIPADGEFIFCIKQTLISPAPGSQTYQENILINNFSISLDTDDLDDLMKTTKLINPSNNVDIQIDLPISDMPVYPNDSLMFSLYFTYNDGSPTRLWHTINKSDYNSLINHLILTALTYKQNASKRISGDMRTGQHIDMNTVVKDDIYLNSAFYVNSMEIDCREDNINVELNEMPGLLKITHPGDDDCEEILSINITFALKCGNYIILISGENIVCYDVLTSSTKTIQPLPSNAFLFPGEGVFILRTDENIKVIEPTGKIIKNVAVTGNLPASYLSGKIYYLLQINSNEMMLEAYSENGRYSRLDLSTVDTIAGKYDSLLSSPFSIIINTDTGNYVFDKRINLENKNNSIPNVTKILSISDYYVIGIQDNNIVVFRRENISLETLVKIKSFETLATKADHTLSDIAWLDANGEIKIWDIGKNVTSNVINKNGKGSILDIMFLGGNLYVIRQQGIYKYYKK